MNVLTVDYRSENAAEKFAESLKNTGFGVIKNHPLSPDLINRVYADWQSFFNSTDKMSYTYDPTKDRQNGYFPMWSENAKYRDIPDIKEFYHVDVNGPIPSSVKTNTMQMYGELVTLGRTLLGWLQTHTPETIQKKWELPLPEMLDTDRLLRVIHYPALDIDHPDGAVRAAAHEDINLITLLPAATAPGLEVLDVNGEWHAVSCDPGTIVVNAGDMLQMCSEHFYKSTTHRVVNPNGPDAHSPRYSMPLFLHPHSHIKLSPTVTAGDYLAERLREIGLKKSK